MGSRMLSALCAATLVVVACGGADAAPEAQSVALDRLVTGLDSPLHVAVAPGEAGRLYIVEKTGRIRVWADGALRSEPFFDLRGNVSLGSEQGLLSMAFHPRYAQNRRFYVNYTDTNGDTRIVEYRSDGTRALPRTRRQLLFVDQPYSNHNGGLVVFGPNGRLYVGMGDGGSGGDPHNFAQRLSSFLGKLLTINVDRRGAKPQIVALGLRNPWRFSFDRRTGDLYVGDVGQNAWEEVNFVPRRSKPAWNFGWRVWEGRARFASERPNPKGRLVRPIAVYPLAGGHCAVTGGFVYRGSAVPALRGRYVYGDYCSGTIWSLRVVGGRARGVRREPIQMPQLSSFAEDARGELYVVSLEGTVSRLTN